MNKKELATEAAGKVGMTQKDTQNVVDAVTETIISSLSNRAESHAGWFWHFSRDGEKGKRRKESSDREKTRDPGKKGT